MRDGVAASGATVKAEGRVLLGCAIFGGVGSLPDLIGRGDNREASFALMSEAWDGGISWFDTADAYGGGLSERWIGEWIRESGHRPKLTSKTYNAMAPGADFGLSRERIVRQIASTLERLQVDCLDVYLLHEFDRETPLSETMDALDELLSQEVIAAYGVSNFSAEQLEAALGAGRPAVVQNSYSLLRRTDELDVIPLCAEHGISYQAYSPLAGGWLSGKYRKDQPLEPNSRLALVPQWYEHIDAHEAFSALEAFATIGEREPLSIGALALAWVYAQPHVAEMVVGPRNHGHLQAVWEALDSGVRPELLEQITALFPLRAADV